MASPFTIFRKHQKIFLAALALLAMIAFVFLSGPVFDSLTSSRVRNPIVVSTKTYGNLTEADLAHLMTQQNMVLNFFDRVYRTMGLALPMTPPSEESVVETWILANRAQELGIVISNSTINAYLQNMFGDRISRETLRQILREMRMSERQLFEALRMELAARQMLEMIDFSAAPTSPAQRWDYYLRLNRRATIELVAEPAAKYVDRVGEPEETTLRDFFEKYKENYYDPTSPEPGFRRPHRVVLEYLKADIAQFMEPASITEEQIQQYYEKNKDSLYLRSKLPPVEKTLPQEPSASKEKPQEPSPKESTPGAKPETPPKPESAPSDSKPAQPTPAEAKPSEAIPAEAKPAEPKPAQPTPSEPTPVEAKPADSKPAEPRPTASKPTEPKPTESKPTEPKPHEEKPAAEKPEASKPASGETSFAPDRPEGRPVSLGNFGTPLLLGQEGVPEGLGGLWTTSADSGESVEKSPASKEAKKESVPQEPPKESATKESTAEEPLKEPASKEPKQEPSKPSAEATPKEATAKEPPAKEPTPKEATPKEATAKEPASKEAGAKESVPSASPAETSKYVPLEEVKDEIREALARGQAQAKIEQILTKIRDQMNSYAQTRSLAIARGKEPPAMISLESLAKQQGLEYRKTGLISEWQFRRDLRDIAQAMIGGRDSVVRYLFHQGRPPLQATLAQDVDAYYLFWKLEDVKEAVPSWDYSEAERLEKDAEKARAEGNEPEAAALMEKAQRARKDTEQLRQEVLRTWKMIQARSLARNRAAQLAAIAQKSGKPLSEALAQEPGVTVLEAGPFTWLTHGTISPRFFLQAPPPRISTVPQVEMAGEEFMETVFRMQPSDVEVAFNQPQTVAYVIRVKSFEPSWEVLWKMFLAERYEDYSSAAIFDQRKIRHAWMEQIKRSIGFRWERKPHPAALE